MPRPKGSKDGKERKEKKKLTSKELYAMSEKYKLLAEAEKGLEDARQARLRFARLLSWH
jgi:hypothetical protein